MLRAVTNSRSGMQSSCVFDTVKHQELRNVIGCFCIGCSDKLSLVLYVGTYLLTRANNDCGTAFCKDSSLNVPKRLG